MRRLAVAASAMLLVGCVSGQTVQPPEGPMLVVDVTNASAAEATLDYEFESEGTSGAGEARLPACRRESLPLSSIRGSYQMRVEGATIADGVVPAAAGRQEFLVIRLLIGPDGGLEAAAPVASPRHRASAR